MKRSALKRKTPLRAKGGSRFHGRALPDYREWIRRQPCAVRGCTTSGVFSLITVAHVKSRGAGGGDRENIVPLCLLHHQYQHHIGIRSFERDYHIDLQAEAERLWREYQAEVEFEVA